MQCTDIREQLSALLYGELSSTAREAVSRHVKACARCALAFEDVKRVRSLLDESAVSETVDVTDRIMARMAHLVADPPAGHGTVPACYRRGWAVVAAVAALVLLSLVVGRHLWVTPEQESSVDELVQSTESLVSDVREAFLEAGRGVTAATATVAGETKGVWLAMADSVPVAQIGDFVNQGRAIITEDLGEMSAAVGRFLLSPQREDL